MSDTAGSPATIPTGTESTTVSSTDSTTDSTGPTSPETGTPTRGRRKVRYGVVVSDKMDKTVVVAVEDHVKHALYSKVLRRTTRLKAHDESIGAALGDRVTIAETRPMSATKRWRVVEIVEKAE